MQAALNAGETAGRTLKVYAVEKNANAVITLRNRAIMDEWTNVTIVAKDMRDWVRIEKKRIFSLLPIRPASSCHAPCSAVRFPLLYRSPSRLCS